MDENVSFGHKTIGLKDVLSAARGQLLASAHFNYMFDISWLLRQYPKEFRKLPILLIHGSKDTKNMKDQLDQMKTMSIDHNISLFGVHLKDMFGTHHSKLMLLRYENGLRVVIHTSNLIEEDWKHKTQGLWMSEIFPKLTTGQERTKDDSKTQFKSDLLRYLENYDSEEVSKWIQLIRDHDLSSCNAFLVSSVPGRHRNSLFGHLRLRHLLKSSSAANEWPIVGQFSSIGSLGPKPESWLTGEFLTSLSSSTKTLSSPLRTPLKLIYPSVKDVANSLEGYKGGGSLPYSQRIDSKQKFLKDFLHLWRSDARGRSHCCPHIKTYSRFSADFNQLSYFLLTSANLSKAAWGQLQKNNQELYIRSFEIGVLFLPQIFGKEFFCVKDFPLIPFDIPLIKYSSKDEIWTYDSKHEEMDRFGNTWEPN